MNNGIPVLPGAEISVLTRISKWTLEVHQSVSSSVIVGGALPEVKAVGV